MKIIKNLKWNLIVLAIVLIALGIVLIANPDATLEFICYMLAVLLIVVGTVSLVNYLRKDVAGMIYRYDLVVGLCTILGAVLVLIKIEDIKDLIPVVLGFIITSSGILKMQNSVDMLRLKHGKWYISFALAMINIVVGIVLLINPFKEETTLILMVGIALVYSGLSDLFVTISVSKALSDLNTRLEMDREKVEKIEKKESCEK